MTRIYLLKEGPLTLELKLHNLFLIIYDTCEVRKS